MDRLTSMAVFARVVATRSFSAAARDLGMSQAAASKHIQTLENWIGARLLNRTTRRVGLTEAGESFHAQCTRILEDTEAARQAGKPDARLRGNLRISAPVAFGSTGFAALAVEFMAQNADLNLSVILSDRPVDVIEEGYDLAIRIGYVDHETTNRAGLMIFPLAPVSFVACASPDYLRSRGVPEKPSDLARHSCLTDMRHPGDIWRFLNPNGEQEDVIVGGRLRTDNGLLRQGAARAGAGILVLPRFLVEEDLRSGRLVVVLSNYQVPPAHWQVVCPAHRAAAPKVRGLISFLGLRLGMGNGSAK